MTDSPPQLDELFDLCGRLGIEVRMENLGGEGGGLCTIRGKRVLFVDVSADTATRAQRCLAALAGLPELDGVYLTPVLREAIERARGSSLD
jgi:hypothetical protein